MKRAFTLLEIVIIVAILAVVAALLLPVFSARGTDHPRVSCLSNLRQIGMGLSQYTQDYSDQFPPVRITPTKGWIDASYPYIKSTGVFQCEKATHYSLDALATDYFLNRYLSCASASKVKNPSATLLLGDGDDNAPTWNSWMALPSDATSNSYSPSRRHEWGAEYCFADGHAKWIRPEDLPQQVKWSLQ